MIQWLLRLLEVRCTKQRFRCCCSSTATAITLRNSLWMLLPSCRHYFAYYYTVDDPPRLVSSRLPSTSVFIPLSLIAIAIKWMRSSCFSFISTRLDLTWKLFVFYFFSFIFDSFYVVFFFLVLLFFITTIIGHYRSHFVVCNNMTTVIAYEEQSNCNIASRRCFRTNSCRHESIQ